MTFYQDSVDAVARMVREEFEVDEANSLDKIDDLGEMEFGYRSVHLIVSLSSQRAVLREWKRHTGLSAEIQIRSVLQHAWAAISYQLNYKRSSRASRKLLRQLSRLSAQLEMADEEFTVLQSEEAGTPHTQNAHDTSLNAATLQDFLKQTVDLQKWERLGVRVGMQPFPQLVSKYHATGVQILLHALQTVGIATLADFEHLLRECEKQESRLQQFVELVNAQEESLYAVPVDVLGCCFRWQRPMRCPVTSAGEACMSHFLLKHCGM